MSNIIGKLELIKERWEEVGKKIIDPEIISDMKQYVKLTKEYKDLEEVVKALDKLKSLNSNIETNREIIKTESDPDFVEMAKEELSENESELEVLNEEIKLLLIPKDPEDAKNVVVEIRAGAGGDEASIFAGDLYRMYTKYASTKGWQTEIVDTADGTNGGYKEIIFEINGADVYGEMKYESGVHRVQRVPQTETQGRVHTSAASVIVLPEAEEFDIEIKKADLRVDSYCSSGPGGQSVNTTDSAVRMTHLPTNTVVTCQNERSQLQNKIQAMKVLRSRLYDLEMEKKRAEEAVTEANKQEIGWGAQIRSYVLHPYKLVKDVRTNFESGNADKVLDGDLDGFMDSFLRWSVNSKLETES